VCTKQKQYNEFDHKNTIAKKNIRSYIDAEFFLHGNFRNCFQEQKIPSDFVHALDSV